MLAANEAVARLTRTHQLPSLYRVHDEPDAEKLAEFREPPRHLRHPGRRPHLREEIVKLLVILATTRRATRSARSSCAACARPATAPRPTATTASNKKDYTHFTSPIRRYADLVVHRVFDTYLEKHKGHAAPPRAMPATISRASKPSASTSARPRSRVRKPSARA
jgi:ribonuclease R